MKYVVKIKTNLETQIEEFPTKQARDMFLAQLMQITKISSFKFEIESYDEENND